MKAKILKEYAARLATYRHYQKFAAACTWENFEFSVNMLFLAEEQFLNYARFNNLPEYPPVQAVQLKLAIAA